MAVKISEMVAGSALDGAEKLEMVQGGNTRRTTVGAVIDYAKTLLVALTGNASIATVQAADDKTASGGFAVTTATGKSGNGYDPDGYETSRNTGGNIVFTTGDGGDASAVARGGRGGRFVINLGAGGQGTDTPDYPAVPGVFAVAPPGVDALAEGEFNSACLYTNGVYLAIPGDLIVGGAFQVGAVQGTIANGAINYDPYDGGVNAKLSFFGQPLVFRQSGGTATAGGTYTSNEQVMLNKVYSALRNLGLMA